MKLKTSIIGFLVASGGFASAATLLTQNLEVQLLDPSGATAVPATVMVGFIDTTTADITSFDGISAGFTSLGSFTATYAGTYTGVWAGESIGFTDAAGAAGKNVFYFISTGDAYALFEDTSVQFLADAAIPNSNASSATTAKFDSGAFVTYAGTYSSSGGADVAGSLTLAPVPEPSIAILGSLGVLGMAVRRRRA
ncbi:PEP-CTERM sorting domain-containing protein [Haloferula sargassicola]|uniref:Ice-binding protein C-terminal domain-containing protein n=1 Tax=Haloferula sargassicola TaxID=490096 RepID=A0ABP9UTJ3_9BACT